MHTFRDAQERVWELRITVASLARVQAHAGVDLAALLDGQAGLTALGQLLQQPVRLAQVLWVLVEPQAQARGITPEEFGEALFGDALEAAAEAFVAELVFFIPNRQLRQQLGHLIAKSRELSAELLRQQAERIAQLDPQTLAARFAASPTSSAESSASTPDR